MDPKETIRPQVIVEYTADRGFDQQKTRFCAAYVDGFSGSDIMLLMPIGGCHLFSRKDGTWLDGDCLNYVGAAIREFGKVEAAIQAGYHGDVEMHAKSLPMCAPSS
jgi:hypothetical protein